MKEEETHQGQGRRGKDEQKEKQGRKMEEEKEVPHLTLDNFHLDSQVRLYSYLGFNVSSRTIFFFHTPISDNFIHLKMIGLLINGPSKT